MLTNTSKKIVLVGPVYPYKGGISHYTGLMYRALSKKYDVEMISYSFQYPKLLYKKEQRDYSNDSFKIEDTNYLIKAMPDIEKKIDNCKLLIVGDFGDDKAEYMQLIEQNGVLDIIDIYDGYIPDKEVEKNFAASDVVVLPYISATQSGIVQIAYGFDKPVIATNVGGLPDVVTEGKTGFLVEPENPQAIADAVTHFFAPGVEDQLISGAKAESYRFSWDRVVEHIERLTTFAIEEQCSADREKVFSMHVDIESAKNTASQQIGAELELKFTYQLGLCA